MLAFNTESLILKYHVNLIKKLILAKTLFGPIGPIGPIATFFLEFFLEYFWCNNSFYGLFQLITPLNFV